MEQPVQFLVVDDSPSAADTFAALLRRRGYVVMAESTAKAGLARARQNPPDVALLDVVLPDGDGVSLCRAMRAEPALAHSFVVLVSGLATAAEERAAGLRAGADDYLVKPFNANEFLARMQAIVRIQQAERRLRESEAQQRELARQFQALNQQLEARVLERTAELRTLPRRIIQTQEQERQRVARELHDSVNQLLASAVLRLGSPGRHERSDPPDSLPARLLKARELVEKAAEEVRRISRNLRPSELDDFGLRSALRSLCDDLKADSGIEASLRWRGAARRVPPEYELQLYRIAQEALNNARRHACPTRIQIGFELHDQVLELEVRDNGHGFESAGAGAPRLGNGLENMRERAALLGGSCTIHSGPRQGTTVLVRVPLPPES